MQTLNRGSFFGCPSNVQTKSCSRRMTLPKGVSCNISTPGQGAGPRQVSYQRTSPPEERLKVISLVASCVQINADVARFEVFAGRSAMVGFAVAFFTELLLPHEGLFGSWRSESYSAYAAVSLFLITGAVILATMTKRRLGLQFKEAVLTSLTALSRSASSITQRNVDAAVDYVFEQVFGTKFVDSNLFDIDDFI